MAGKSVQQGGPPRAAATHGYDVVALGRACVDEVLEVAAYPAEDEKAPLLVRLREGGGQASTAACLVAALGGRAAFVGVLGDDQEGCFARERMEAFGVHTTFCPPPRGKTPLAYCIVSREAGSRTILYEPGRSEPLGWEELEPSVISRARSVLVDPQARHLLPRLVPLCRSRGVPVVADAERAEGAWQETWGLADVLAASENFLRQAAPGLEPQEALLWVAGQTRGVALATLGARGAIACIEGRVVRFPAPAVNVRDTTGAGDAFHGGLCLALARRMPVEDAIRCAVAAASLSCRGLGGRSFPGEEEVQALWRELPVRR